MLRLLFPSILFLFSLNLQAKENSLYQIDLILFSHQQDSPTPEFSLRSTLTSPGKEVIALQPQRTKDLSPYHLLSPSLSKLREEFWALHRNPQYHVLFNYSWLQPVGDLKTVLLPPISSEGWQVEGTVRVQPANYYLLKTELLLSSSDKSNIPFVFAEKQRLKTGDSYYFDHPQVGMLIKIHQLS